MSKNNGVIEHAPQQGTFLYKRCRIDWDLLERRSGLLCITPCPANAYVMLQKILRSPYDENCITMYENEEGWYVLWRELIGEVRNSEEILFNAK